jgi:hypothetical protein
MKKSLLLGILGVAATVATSYGQGFIFLDNYFSNFGGPIITYGAGSDGPLATGVSAAYTVGIYLGQGSFTASADPSGTASPTSLNALLLLQGGANTSTAAGYAGYGGYFSASGNMQASVASGATITAMVVAYEGASYDTATYRGHSAAFQLVTKDGTANPPASVSPAYGGFSVFSTSVVPEPSTLTLAGLGLASMLVARRRK